MKRILIVYNPRSSRFKDVEREVLDAARDLKGYMVGKYEVENTNVDDNAKKFAKILRDGDLVVSAGGDATGVIAVNGIMLSGKKAKLSVLPYGNFNDLARTLGVSKLNDVLEGEAKEYWPLDIIVDGKHFRYASCYVTMGMTAEAVELFDEPKFRKKMQKGSKSSWRSYIQLVKWYFKNRHKKSFIPRFRVNGVLQHAKVSDYAAMNGTSMCRVMKTKGCYQYSNKFVRLTGRLTSFWRLSWLMIRSIFVCTPHVEIEKDEIEFLNLATVELQAEGEYKIFKDISKIEVKKADKPLTLIFHK